jgi:hypothetical protein
VDPQTGETKTWLGTGKRGTELKDGAVELSEPAGLTVIKNELIIADTNNHRLLATNLETKATRDLVIEGLVPPTPKQTVVEDKTPVTTLPAQTVKTGAQVTLHATFELPMEFKLNKLAPVVVQWKSLGGDAVVHADVLASRQKVTAEGLEASLPVTLSGAGTGEYEVTISYSFCRDGTGGVCRFGKVKYKLPLTVADTGTAETIELTIKSE